MGGPLLAFIRRLRIRRKGQNFTIGEMGRIIDTVIKRDDMRANDIRKLKQFTKYPTDDDLAESGWHPAPMTNAELVAEIDKLKARMIGYHERIGALEREARLKREAAEGQPN